VRPEVDAPALLDRLGISYRRKGRALLAPCPLPGHDEKEPSWSIRDEPGEEKHGAHYCFGCARGGGPADLVAAVLRIDLRAAREWIRSGAVFRESDLPAQIVVSVKRSPPPFALPDGVTFAPLGAWPTPARAYLQKRRVDPAQAARWGLGYAVDGRLAMLGVEPHAAEHLVWERAHLEAQVIERGGRGGECLPDDAPLAAFERAGDELVVFHPITTKVLLGRTASGVGVSPSLGIA
jgi:hypothetical protein